MNAYVLYERDMMLRDQNKKNKKHVVKCENECYSCASVVYNDFGIWYPIVNFIISVLNVMVPNGRIIIIALGQPLPFTL